MRVWMIGITLLFAATAAAADLTATYVNPRGIETSIEVNELGWVRIGANRKEEGDGPPDYSLLLPAGDYFVFTDQDQRKAVDWKLFRQLIFSDVLSGEPVPAVDSPEARAKAARVPRPPLVGKVVVDGRQGTVYLVEDEHSWRRHHWYVVSRDPELRPLAEAYARFIRSRPEYINVVGEADVTLHQAAWLMTQGAPLEMGELKLISVSRDAIDPGRFRLPGAPLNAEEYRKIIGYSGIGVAEQRIKPARP